MSKRKETIEAYIERLKRTLQRLGVELPPEAEEAIEPLKSNPLKGCKVSIELSDGTTKELDWLPEGKTLDAAWIKIYSQEVELDDLEAEIDRRAMAVEEVCKLLNIPPEKLSNDQDDTKPII